MFSSLPRRPMAEATQSGVHVRVDHPGAQTLDQHALHSGGATLNGIGVFDTRENADSAISLLNGGSVCGFTVSVGLVPDAGDAAAEESDDGDEDDRKGKRARKMTGEHFSLIDGKFVHGYMVHP
jgi:hypothetical protein